MAVVRSLVRSAGVVGAAGAVLLLGALIVNGTVHAVRAGTAANAETRAAQARASLFTRGRNIFRFDTFGDQAFWGDALQLHRAIAGAENGGVGPGVSPKTALAVGLKVDATAIPKQVAAAIKAGKVDLNDPKVTLDLLKLNAVVGVKGFFDSSGRLSSMGITCAVCHSGVDDSFAPGIGRRLDGWPNQDLNVGKIISLAPNKKPLTDLLRVNERTLDKVLLSWGPGEFDAELSFDGKAFRPDGKPASTRIPAAFGLAGVNLHTWTGSWGTVTYWNALVANLEMHGQGNFFDPRLDNKKKFPIAARARMGHTHNKVDLITPKLPALHYYQLSLPAPKPPRGSFDAAAAARGGTIFDGKGKCSNCHMAPTFSEPGWNLHAPKDICIDGFQASRSPDGKYRTAPLQGMFARSKRGFYHDGRFPTLAGVVRHYDACFGLHLTAQEQSDLVQFVKSR